MPSPGTSGTPVTGTGQVSIANFAFSPSAISVKVGTTVTWTNNDSMTHTVTSTSGPTSFDSGPRTAGQTFSYTFASTGTWNYWCSFHPSMTGTVTVTN
jgi:plastocyanin